MVQTAVIEIPGEELEAMPVDEFSPALVRVETLEKTATGYLYAIDFVGLEPGEYDVTQFLRTPAGESPASAPHLLAVERKLPDDFRGEIYLLPRRVGLRPPWYEMTAWGLACLWALCLPALIFLGRTKPENEPLPEVVTLSLRQRLRRLVDEMAADESKEAWQKLEATLIQYLAESRRVSTAKAFEQLVALKADGVAGPAIRAFEHSLHAPGGRGRQALDRALAECARVLEVDA